MPRIKRLASAGRTYAAHDDLLTPNAKARLAWVQLGELVLPTGALVACDPLVSPRTPPFPHILPPGTYPVWMAHDLRYREVACILLRLATEPPTRWEEVSLASQEQRATMALREHWGFGVDSGIGALMDVAVAQQVADVPAIGKAILAEAHKRNKTSYANIVVDQVSGANVIAFSTAGDGVFVTYFGYDAADTVVSIVVAISLFGTVAAEGAE